MKNKSVLFEFNFKQLAYFSYICLNFWALINLFTIDPYKISTRLFNFIVAPCTSIILFKSLQSMVNKGKIYFDSNTIRELSYFSLICVLSLMNSFSQLVIVIRSFIVLILLSYYLQYRNRISLKLKLNLEKVFYWIFLIVISINLLFYGSLTSDFYFPSIMDKNYTGVMIYLFLLFSFHRKNMLGISISCFYILFMTQSRSLYGMIAIYFIVKIFKSNIWQLLQKFHLKESFKQFTLLFIAIACLSSYWINFVSVKPIVRYREGLNDGSNKMRFVANVYAENQILNDPQYIYKGKGEHIKEAFGIADENLSLHTQFMGVRLVQPHNSFLNLMLKIGVIEAVIYFMLLGKLLDKVWSRENMEYYIPYLINACFMHSLLDGNYLVIWLYILMNTQECTEGDRLCNYKVKMPFSIFLGRSS